MVVDDQIRGAVEFDWGQEQDHVVQRADGSTADFLPYTSMTTASTAYLVLTLALGLPAAPG